jgi:hypothetical protein
MANIQEAAKWMRTGRDVRRAAYAGKLWLVPYEPRRETFQIVRADGLDRVRCLTCEDLLADDWELTS